MIAAIEPTWYLVLASVLFGIGAFGLLVFLALLLTFSFTMLMLAPRLIPAPEVSLLMPIETVVGVALVWWVIGEVPSSLTIIGGTIIVGCLTVNSVLLLRNAAKH